MDYVAVIVIAAPDQSSSAAFLFAQAVHAFLIRKISGRLFAAGCGETPRGNPDREGRQSKGIKKLLSKRRTSTKGGRHKVIEALSPLPTI